jgi:hypothetical protein
MQERWRPVACSWNLWGQAIWQLTEAKFCNGGPDIDTKFDLTTNFQSRDRIRPS